MKSFETIITIKHIRCLANMFYCNLFEKLNKISINNTIYIIEILCWIKLKNL